jgi:hypothetical protein
MGELTRHGWSLTQARPLTRYHMRSKRLRRKQSSDQPLSIAQKGSPSQLPNKYISFWLVLSFYSWLIYILLVAAGEHQLFAR